MRGRRLGVSVAVCGAVAALLTGPAPRATLLTGSAPRAMLKAEPAATAPLIAPVDGPGSSAQLTAGEPVPVEFPSGADLPAAGGAGQSSGKASPSRLGPSDATPASSRTAATGPTASTPSRNASTPGRPRERAREQVFTGRVVVKLTSSTDPTSVERAVAAAGASLAGTRRTATGATLVTASGDAAAAAALIAAQPGVEYAVPERRLAAAVVPDDPDFAKQWDLTSIGVPAAWESGDGTGVTVAVLDTGRLDHPDLKSNYLPGYDFISDPVDARDGTGRDPDPADVGDWAPAGVCGPVATQSSWHGLHVAGTIAAVTGNGLGLAGVAPGAKVLPVRVLGRCGGSNVDVADAMVWAAGGTVPGVPLNPHPARVINLSLSGPGVCTPVEQTAIDAVRARGSLVVVAAGNANADVAGFTPANCRGVLTVGANDQFGSPAGYSNFGSSVALSAPGSAIWGLGNNGTRAPDTNGWSLVQRYGTSMAAPHVSGVAALLWSAVPTATADQVRGAMTGTASPFAAGTTGRGAGVVDARAAMSRLAAQLSTPPTVTKLSVPGVRAATGGVLTLTGTGLAGASMTWGGQVLAVVAGSATSLTVRVPSGPVGTISLTLRTAGGAVTVPFFLDARHVVGRDRQRVVIPAG